MKYKYLLNNKMEAIDIPYDYVEIILSTNCRNQYGRQYDIPKELFDSYLQKMKNMKLKYFQSDFKEYINGDLHLIKKIEDNTVKETKLYNLIPVHINDNENFRVVYYEKKKLSTIAYQSSRKQHSVCHKRKLIFRVNNKIYINFQQEICDENIFHKIYINFNNSKDSDIKSIIETISDLIKMLQA